MTNYHAIATVTATLRDLLHEKLSDSFDNISITAKPLDVLEKNLHPVGLNIFLYQVTPNQGYRNFSLPSRNQGGELVNIPTLGLNLDYLLTAYTNEIGDSLEELLEIKTHQILAKTMLAIHQNPVLDKSRIINVRSSIPILSDPHSESTDYLEFQTESIRFSQNSLSLEEFTKIWSSFFQTKYRLSVSYHASVVLLKPKIIIKPSFPVQERNFNLISTISHPLINKIQPNIVDSNPQIIHNDKVQDVKSIEIFGKNIIGNNLKVLFDSQVRGIIKHHKKINDGYEIVEVGLPDQFKAGKHYVTVRHNFANSISNGVPETDSSDTAFSNSISNTKYVESNAVMFGYAPCILGSKYIDLKKGESFSLTITPGIHRDQTVDVFIGNTMVSVDLPQDSSILYPLKTLPPIEIPGDLLAQSEEDKNEDKKNSPYLLRIRVDDIYSFIYLDDDVNSNDFGNYYPGLRLSE